MKSNRQTYGFSTRTFRPVCPAVWDSEKWNQTGRRSGRFSEKSLECHKSKYPDEDCRSLLIEYDDLIRQEKNRYSQLMTELKKIQWFTHYVLLCSNPYSGTLTYSGLDPVNLYKNYTQNSLQHLDVCKPPGSECNFDRRIHEATLFDKETTRLTDAEIRHGCELTMEEVLSKRKLPPNRDIGKYSQKAGNRYRKARRSIKSLQEKDVSISWMTGQILQRWLRVYSFSSTICCAWKIGEHKIVYRSYSGKNKSTYGICSEIYIGTEGTKMTIIIK